MCRQQKAAQALVQGLLAQLEEFGTKTVRLGATHRFKRTDSDPGRYSHLSSLLALCCTPIRALQTILHHRCTLLYTAVSTPA